MNHDVLVVALVLAVTFFAGLSGWLFFVNARLSHEFETVLHDKNLLQLAVDDARSTFNRYAEIHLAKKTAEGDKKAHSNAEHARAMARVLQTTGFSELGPLQSAFRDVGINMAAGMREAMGNHFVR